MYKEIIKKYVNILKKDDIISFAKKKNLLLEDNEVNLIYETIKNRYKDILDDGIKVINEYKNRLKNNTYNKLIEVYNDMKKHYNL